MFSKDVHWMTFGFFLLTLVPCIWLKHLLDYRETEPLIKWLCLGSRKLLEQIMAEILHYNILIFPINSLAPSSVKQKPKITNCDHWKKNLSIINGKSDQKKFKLRLKIFVSNHVIKNSSKIFVMLDIVPFLMVYMYTDICLSI